MYEVNKNEENKFENKLEKKFKKNKSLSNKVYPTTLQLKNFEKLNKVYNETFQEIKPWYRGILHKNLACIIFIVIILLLISNKHLNYIEITNLKNNYFSLYLSKYNKENQKKITINNIVDINNDIILLLLVKLYSYTSSAFYHTYYFDNHKMLNIFYKNDLIAISLSIFIAPYILYRNMESESIYPLFNYFFFIINFISTVKDNKFVSSYWDYLRMSNLICHVLYCYIMTLNIITNNIKLTISFINYTICVLCYGLKQIDIKPMVWHKPLVYGFHEDFHFFLLIADTCLLITFIEFRYSIY